MCDGNARALPLATGTVILTASLWTPKRYGYVLNC